MSRTYYQTPKRIEKLSRDEIIDISFDLINAFKMVSTPYETASLIQDLLTASEIKNLAKRLRIAKLLIAGKTQREVARILHASTATVTKVGLWLNQGGEGLRNVISKLPKKYEVPKKFPRGPVEFHLPELLAATAQYAASTHQKNRVEKFLEKVDDKIILDKSLQEAFDEEYRSHPKKKRANHI